MSNHEARSSLVAALREVAASLEQGNAVKSFSVAKDAHGVYQVHVHLLRSVAIEPPEDIGRSESAARRPLYAGDGAPNIKPAYDPDVSEPEQ